LNKRTDKLVDFNKKSGEDYAITSLAGQKQLP